MKTRQLIGHAMMTRINWDGNPGTIPDGWQGSARRSYDDMASKKFNTLVGMFVYIEDCYRMKGWATAIVKEMLSFGKRCGLSYLLIPLLLPERYDKEYAGMPYEEFAFQKREDGQYKDHWLRLHVRLGAKIIGVCNTSHQHAMSLKDFYQQFNVSPTVSGYHLISKNGKWYRVYADIERAFVIINEGCVWVQHSLNGPKEEAQSGAAIIEKHTIQDFIKYLKRKKICSLLAKYDIKRKFPDMRDFRLGPNMIEKIPLDWIILFD